MFLIKKKESLNKVFLIILTALSFNISFAGTDEALQLLNNLSFLITAIITMSGVGMLIWAGSDLKEIGENKNQNKKPSSAIIKFVLAALLFNYVGSIQMFSVSLLGDQAGYCLESSQTCLDVSNSEAMTDVVDKISKDNSSLADKIIEKLTVIETVFQIVGLYLFAKGVLIFKDCSENKHNASFSKALLYLILSSILMNSVLFYDQIASLFQSLIS